MPDSGWPLYEYTLDSMHGVALLLMSYYRESLEVGQLKGVDCEEIMGLVASVVPVLT